MVQTQLKTRPRRTLLKLNSKEWSESLAIYSCSIMQCKLCLPRETELKSNQIKSLLLSHHHSTSALVSEILMSVLQTVQKNNRQFTYGQTVQKNNKQFTYGQTVQKNNKQFTYGQTVQKKQQTIYIWTDSAKKTTNNLHMDRQCKKNNKQFTYGQTVQKNNNNLHMDSTYLQTIQKTVCKIHVHIVYYKDTLNYQRHIIHRMGTSTLCILSIHNVVYT